MQDVDVDVQLFAKAMELAKTGTMGIKIGERTPLAVIKALADANPLLSSAIIRDDGTPRSSTKILIDGAAPPRLDQAFPDGARVQVAIVTACDG